MPAEEREHANEPCQLVAGLRISLPIDGQHMLVRQLNLPVGNLMSEGLDIQLAKLTLADLNIVPASCNRSRISSM
jgi:hypothetical protein